MEGLREKLEQRKATGGYRSLKNIDELEAEACCGGSEFINLSSNDYLSLGNRLDLRQEFLEILGPENFRMCSSSSRLLTGNTNEYEELEKLLCELYCSEAALVTGSGYHANSGILPAISDTETLILADKLIHASLIDGVMLSKGKTIRYRHNDYDQLERLVETNYQSYRSLIIVTESIFSMDGDEADLERLVKLKKRYPNIVLYIDEAHAVGLRGKSGLGCCEESGCQKEIDIIVGTFGKALASTGAFVICNRVMYEYLVNTMRTLIFTTALPPVNLAWTSFILKKIPALEQERKHVAHISAILHEYIRNAGLPVISTSHIIPIIIGSNQVAVQIAEELQREGFYIMPIRPPAVPEGSARLRISLCADNSVGQIRKLIHKLKELHSHETSVLNQK